MNSIANWKEFSLSMSASSAQEIGADDPRREVRAGAIVAVLFFVLFLGWAAFAPMDAAAYAPGHLQVSGQRQTVQHRENRARV